MITLLFCRKFYHKFGSPDAIDMTRHTDTTVCDRYMFSFFRSVLASSVDSDVTAPFMLAFVLFAVS